EEYGVDYLIVATSEGDLQKKDSCYLDMEPHTQQAGEHSCTMKGSFCVKPIYKFFTSVDEHYTYIFPVSQQAIAQAAQEAGQKP
ncbi:MAG TPA: hypothetical protein VFJ29_00455, partial [Candidatus Kapabacteria bacterium]|nr:hypothetical protein [Candidatus Kapabacteria bacterium]